MNATVEAPNREQQNSEKLRGLIVLLIVFTTVLAALLAALQADASIRADIANRESQYLAIRASAELHRAGLETNYEFNVLGDYLKNLQEATILQLTALEQEQRGEEQAAQATRNLAAISQARADAGEKFSVLYTDPRYASRSEEEMMPDMAQYMDDLNAKSNEMVARQNEAADAYSNWNRKADSYVTALTILAVAFFLFGLAQAVSHIRLRLSFIVFGSIVILFTLMMTAVTLVG